MNMSPWRILCLFGQQPVKTNESKSAHSSHHPDPSSAQLYFLVFESFQKDLLILLFQANMGQSSLGHILQNWLTDDISGTIFQPDQTNFKGSDGLPLRHAILEQRANLH